MKRMEILKASCTSCESFCERLRISVGSAVSASDQDGLKRLAVHASNTYPSRMIHELKTETRYSALYRLMPPHWFNDLVIDAIGERL